MLDAIFGTKAPSIHVPKILTWIRLHVSRKYRMFWVRTQTENFHNSKISLIPS